jgi:hypothetical protein
MPDLKSIAMLFTGAQAPGKPIVFQWRMIRRKGRPFILVPQQAQAARAGLGLYSAQRPAARIAHALLRSPFGFPFLSLLQHVRIDADEASEMMAFIRDQSEVPFSQLQAPAIMFSCRSAEKRGFVILTRDGAGQNARVIKFGLRPSGHVLVEREADVISQLAQRSPGIVQVTGRISTPSYSAFAMPYCFGKNPRTDEGIGTFLSGWLSSESPVPLESLEAWQTLAAACSEHPGFKALNEALAGRQIATAVQHGDFTPWNIRVDREGKWNVFDWERGEAKGIPGWDWFHFTVQYSILAKRQSPEEVADKVEELISSDRFQKYAAKAGITAIAQPLFLAYLLRQEQVIRPEEGASATSALYELLSRRWHRNGSAGAHFAAATVFVNGKRHQPSTGESYGDRAPGKPASVSLSWLRTYRQTVDWLFNRDRRASNSPSLREQFAMHWVPIMLSWAILAGAATLHYVSNPHMVFTPFYLIPCAMLTLTINWRWGTVVALAAAVAGPLVQRTLDPAYEPFEVVVWNSLMRFLLYLMFVLLLDRVRLEITAPAGSKA